jgi:predicted Zn finger-like uncharacterized protein
LMILTCPQCHAQYKLDPATLGMAGRDVRCVTCSHTWFQIPESAVDAAPQKLAEMPEAAVQPAQSVTDALHNILEKDDAAFQAVLSNVAQSVKGKESKAQEAIEVAHASSAPEPKRKSIIKQDAVIVTHNPLGLGANAFGGLVFLLFCFLTLGVLFAGKGPIVRAWPQMSLLYKSIGFETKAPGEGLRLSEVTAERRIDGNGKVLVLEGKLTNITEQSIAYPTLHVMLRKDSGGVTKTWDVKPGVARVSSGDIIPLMMQLDDPPEDGSTVEVSVKGEK